MSIEKLEYRENNIEKEKSLDLNIVSFNHCDSIDQMIDTVKKAFLENQIDTVILGEYNFTVNEILEEIEKIQNLAKEKEIDIILAPDNNESGQKLTWNELKQELHDSNVDTEQTSLDNNYKPETIGIFIGKNGLTYAFPKTWHRKEVHNPVHKIPGTSVGVTICGEIRHIKPEDLDGVTILYNPSREGDDPYLKYRMLLKYKNATKEDISKALRQESQYGHLTESEADHKKRIMEEDNNFFVQLKNIFGEKEAKKIMEEDRNDQEQNDDSIEARRKKFNKIVEEHLENASDTNSSIYVNKIEEVLREKEIPVIRCDGTKSTGILNPLPVIEVSELEYKNDYARYNLKLEK